MQSENKNELSIRRPKKGEKIVLIGDSFVGKTSLINSLIKGNLEETKPTIGSQHHKYIFTNNKNNEINLDVWDTAGQERFRSVIPMYYKGAKAILVVFDITNKDSFEGAKKWIHEIEQTNKNSSIVLIGNKIDLISYRQVDENAINDYKNAKNISFYECSAKDNLNVENIFQIVGNSIPLEGENTQNNTAILKNNKNDNDINTKNGYCC
jgi:small GTP-binding protein